MNQKTQSRDRELYLQVRAKLLDDLVYYRNARYYLAKRALAPRLVGWLNRWTAGLSVIVQAEEEMP